MGWERGGEGRGEGKGLRGLRALRHLMAQAALGPGTTLLTHTHTQCSATLAHFEVEAHKTKGNYAQLNISPDLAKIISTGKGKRLTRG